MLSFQLFLDHFDIVFRGLGVPFASNLDCVPIGIHSGCTTIGTCSTDKESRERGRMLF